MLLAHIAAAQCLQPYANHAYLGLIGSAVMWSHNVSNALRALLTRQNAPKASQRATLAPRVASLIPALWNVQVALQGNTQMRHVPAVAKCVRPGAILRMAPRVARVARQGNIPLLAVKCAQIVKWVATAP